MIAEVNRHPPIMAADDVGAVVLVLVVAEMFTGAEELKKTRKKERAERRDEIDR